MAKQLFANNEVATIAASVGSTDSTIEVNDASGFPVPSADEFFLLTLYRIVNAKEADHEIVKVTGVSGNTLTVSRGQEGTLARSFSVGELAQMRFTAESAARFRDSAVIDSETDAQYVLSSKGGIPYLEEQ